MINKITIENFKSIQNLDLELGRFNVLIGENGSGKTNILEAIAFAGAASDDKLDNEFLTPRGARTPETKFIMSAFDKTKVNKPIKIAIDFSGSSLYSSIKIKIEADLTNDFYSQLKPNVEYIGKKANALQILVEAAMKVLRDEEEEEDEMETEVLDLLKKMQKEFNSENEKHIKNDNVNLLEDFLIFCPENTSLRNFHSETQIEPLGIKGEGLFKLLTVFHAEGKGKLTELAEHLQLLDWFDGFNLKQENIGLGERTLLVKDRFLDPDLEYFTQRSANEGFLFLLFYFSLFISERTPKFFAIDNIENALNPGLCRKLMQVLAKLAKKYDKQVFFTTHNPAILDGLDLNDEEQRLFVVKRNKLGHTKVNRYMPKYRLDEGKPMRLSEKLMRGYLGGIQNF